MAALVAVPGMGAGEAHAAASHVSRPADSFVTRAGAWTWPVVEHRVVRAYAAPPTPYAAGHRGIDVSAASGTPVSAPADAVVRFSGVVVDRPVVTLDHGDNVLSSYEPVLSTLPVGAVVGRGALIGTVGQGGHCGDQCLHMGVRLDGDYVSPLLFFEPVPPSVLLPLGKDGTH
jgi:murein DD-endopeptidase MepM/ murein hydrolase activator NlpD